VLIWRVIHAAPVGNAWLHPLAMGGRFSTRDWTLSVSLGPELKHDDICNCQTRLLADMHGESSMYSRPQVKVYSWLYRRVVSASVTVALWS
jgi:hypothetical protein